MSTIRERRLLAAMRTIMRGTAAALTIRENGTLRWVHTVAQRALAARKARR